MGLQVRRFGPFSKGVVDAYNSALDTSGALRYARNTYMDGVGRLLARPGTEVALTLYDDQVIPAPVTSVIMVTPFADGALAVGHSTVTAKFYLYRLTSDMTAWFNAAGVLQSNQSPQPAAVLWSAAAVPDKVTIAEGLGSAFIAHNSPGATFQSRVYTVATGIANLRADLDSNGAAENVYFRGFVSFQQHLWGWGYGSEAPGDNDRPELLRFGLPNFATVTIGADVCHFVAGDSFTVGHRVRSFREKVVAGKVAGQVLYVGTNFSLWPVTGFGRDSWDKSRPLDDSYGFAGLLAAASANGVLYYWSHRGPLRVAGLEKPQPLWDVLASATRTVVGDTSIVAVFDPDHDQVLFVYQNGSSGRTSVLAVIDTVRDICLGPDGDIGLGIACADLIQPTGVGGPSAPPTTPSTTAIGSTTATGNLTPGDTSPGTTTIWEYKRVADTIFVVAGETPASQTSFQFTGLTRNTAYHWRAKHLKNGQPSSYLGPTAFTTVNALNPPTTCAIVATPIPHTSGVYNFTVTWKNSGETDVSSEVHVAGPLGAPPVSGTLPLKATVGVGVSSYSFFGYGLTAGQKFYAEIRHSASGPIYSAYSNLATVTLT